MLLQIPKSIQYVVTPFDWNLFSRHFGLVMTIHNITVVKRSSPNRHTIVNMILHIFGTFTWLRMTTHNRITNNVDNMLIDMYEQHVNNHCARHISSHSVSLSTTRANSAIMSVDCENHKIKSNEHTAPRKNVIVAKMGTNHFASCHKMLCIRWHMCNNATPFDWESQCNQWYWKINHHYHNTLVSRHDKQTSFFEACVNQ